jgi:multiple sugar transport system substrate-binding protein
MAVSTQYGLAMFKETNTPSGSMQNNGSILDDMRNPSAPARSMNLQRWRAFSSSADLLETAATQCAMQTWVRPAAMHRGLPQSGQAAMIIQNSSRVFGLQRGGDELRCRGCPLSPKMDSRWGSAGGAAWVMSSPAVTTRMKPGPSWNGSRVRTAASWLYTEAGEIFPALKSVAESDAFLNQDAAARQTAQAFLVQGDSC